MAMKKLEERWTPTTIHATFVSHPRSDSSVSRNVSLDFPLLNLGWTFALRLTPKLLESRGRSSYYHSRQVSQVSGWIPTAFSFRQRDGTIPWRNTSMHAQLSFAVEQHDRSATSEECTPDDNVESEPTPLGTLEVVLADSPSVEVRLSPSSSCTLSLLQPIKIWLSVTVSECPFTNGLFQAISSKVNESEAQACLAKQIGDHLFSRSLATGKVFDVKFLTCSNRSTLGDTAELLQTYASLSVLKGHVDISSAKIREEWTSALAALSSLDNTDAKHVWEISCPSDYEYELDSDFDDEDSSPMALCAFSPTGERNLAILEESNTERSSSSFSSFELDGASDQVLFDNQPEEVIKGSGESPQQFSMATADRERTILVKFAAHRTWYAFLWYCYTGHLEFCKLKSQVEPGGRRLRTSHLDGPLSCSPKSMYRLADLVDDKALKAKALNGIKERMTKLNILDEMFSVFTSKYPEVQKVQLAVLMQHYKSPEVKEAFLRMMLKFGSMPHAESALLAFYDKL